MKLKEVNTFLKGLFFCGAWLFVGQLSASPINLPINDQQFTIETDSISYQQLVENTPQETTDYLKIPYTPKAMYHIKYLRRQLKRTIKKYPNLATKNIGNAFLINEIGNSTRFMKEEKGRKVALKIFAVIATVVVVIKSLDTIKKSN